MSIGVLSYLFLWSQQLPHSSGLQLSYDDVATVTLTTVPYVKGPVREQPQEFKHIPEFDGQIFTKVYFVFKYLSEYQDPLFLDSVFPQELEKIGFSSVRCREVL